MRSRCRGSREIPSLTCSGVTERAPGELGVGSRPLARAHGHLSPSPTLCGYTGIMSHLWEASCPVHTPNFPSLAEPQNGHIQRHRAKGQSKPRMLCIKPVEKKKKNRQHGTVSVFPTG